MASRKAIDRPPVPPPPDPRRRRGRPRSTEADRRILESAEALIVRDGYQGLTIEAVADHAGVAKTTIYRRWSSKPELVAAVLAHRGEQQWSPDTGSLRGDLLEITTTLVDRLIHSPLGPLVRAMQSATAEDPDLGVEAAHGFITDERDAADVIIDRAIARGELSPGVDRELVFDLLVGACLQRYLVTRRPLDAGVARQLVDIVLDGYAG